MSKINTIQWKQFKISELFITEKIGKRVQAPTGANIKKSELIKGLLPRITVTGLNNGVYGYYDCKNNNPNYRVFENFISVSFLGTVFYQEGKASLDMKVHCLKPINIVLNKYTGEYLVTCIRKSLKDSRYSDQISSTVLPLLDIRLPVDKTGNPDFLYMETYMRNLEITISASLTKLQLAKQLAKSNKIDNTYWRNFKIGDLFEIKKGKRLVKAKMKEGFYPFIGASASNNGITAMISNNEHLHNRNTITVAYNGSVGETFYQDKEFWASDDVNIFYPKFNMTKHIAMFIIPLLKKVGQKYTFIDKWKIDDMEQDQIPLPIDEKGNANFSFMELYMKNKEIALSASLMELQAVLR